MSQHDETASPPSETPAGLRRSGLSRYLDRLERASPVIERGRVREVTGLVVRASVPGIAVGDLVRIHCRGGQVKLAEVVGFSDELAVLMPLGDVAGIGPDAEVEPTGQPLSIQCGEGLLGRVLDGVGRPIDGGPDCAAGLSRPGRSCARRPTRSSASASPSPLSMGIRAIDGLLTVGKGQRVGLFAGSGVGKSTLMGQIARGSEAESSSSA